MKTQHNPSRLKLLAALITAVTLSAACSSNAVKPVESSPPVAMQTPAKPANILHINPIETVDATPAEPLAIEPATEVTPPEDTGMTIMATPATAADTAPDAAPADDSARPARLTFNFGFNQAKLDADNQKIVEQHGRFLAEHPQIKLVINGHSDTQGDSRYNEALSSQRAEHVADLLLSQGAMKEQIEIFSWGSKAPLADARHHRDQRRVELDYVEEYWVQSSAE